MLQYLEQKLLQPDKVAGLEVHFLPDGQVVIYTALAGIKKGKIVKEGDIKAVRSVDELSKKIATTTPLSICFNGKGILTRRTELLQPLTNPVAAILPNANPDDFFYEVYGYDHLNTVSIARKEIIEQFIISLRDKGFKVLQLGFGFTSLNGILPFIKHDGKEVIELNAYSLFVDKDNKITDFVSKEITDDKFRLPEYSVSDQYIHASVLPAFSAAVQLLTDNLKSLPAVSSPLVVAERKEFRYFKLFRAAGLFFLAAVFLLLLGNFLVYNHYFTMNRELQVKQLLSQDVQVKTKTLQQSIQQKELFLRRTGWVRSGKVSLYADRIASLTPSNTLLTSMAINPVKGGSNNETSGTHFKNDTIQLSGISDNPVEVNQFINNLKIIPEFREVLIKNYLYKKEEETGTFLIEIIIR